MKVVKLSLEVISVSCYCDKCKTDVKIIDAKHIAKYSHFFEYLLECGHKGPTYRFQTDNPVLTKAEAMRCLRTDEGSLLITQMLGGIRILNCQLNLPDFHNLQYEDE